MIATLALALQAAAAPAQNPPQTRLLTPETYFSLRTAASPAISPDGRRVAYVVRTPDQNRSRIHDEIWAAEMGGAPTGGVTPRRSEPRQLTRTRTGASDPAWSPDARFLAYLSEDPAPGEEEEDQEAVAQVWLLPLDGGAARQLTESPTGVEQFAWLPDGSGIVYLQEEERPGPVAAARRERHDRRRDERVVDADRPRHELWRIDLEEGAARRITRGTLGLSDFAISPDGRWIVYVSNPTGDPDDDRLDDLWLIHAAGGEPRPLTIRPGGESDPRWSPDGRWIAFAAQRDSAVEYSNRELWVLDAAGCRDAPTQGPTEPAQPCPYSNISHWLDRDVNDYRWVANRELVAAFSLGTNVHLYRVTLGTEGQPTALAPAVTGTLVIGDFETTADGRRLAAVVEGPTAWPDLWEIDVGAGSRQEGAGRRRPPAPGSERRNLSRLNPVLDSIRLARQRLIRWAGANGDTVEGILVHPLDEVAPTQVLLPAPAAGSPLLTVVHGGPHGVARNTLRGYYTMQLFAARGYAVLSPNFRGSSGYGNRWATLNRRDLGGDDFRDIVAGADALIARGIADSTRLAIKGLSYGGYMTNWAVTQTGRFRAAISESGIASLVTDYSNSNIPTWERDYLLAYHWENPRIYAERSPLSFVDRIHTPMLIIHGDQDPNTAPANSIELWRALKTLGRRVEFIRYPREEHGLGEPNHLLDKFRREVAWLDRWVLRGGAEPAEYAIGEEVPNAACRETPQCWKMTVTGARRAEYAEAAGDTAFLEITVLWRRTGGQAVERSAAVRAHAPTQGRTELRINWSREAMLDSLPPVGIPVEALGETLLVRGAELTTVLADSSAEATAMRVVFPYRPTALTTDRRLIIRGFAPVRLDR